MQKQAARQASFLGSFNERLNKSTFSGNKRDHLCMLHLEIGAYELGLRDKRAESPAGRKYDISRRESRSGSSIMISLVYDFY